MTQMDNTNKNSAILFKLDLGYNVNANSTLSQFNGNISSMTWNSSKLNNAKSYNFSYDALNRLTAANYTIVQGENYSTSYLYDANGNITKLKRNGKTSSTTYPIIDDLSYAYNGNQLISVNDGTSLNNPDNQEYGFKEFVQKTALLTDTSTQEYLYDANGNLKQDDNKAIEIIKYNYLNLPSEIGYGNGSNIKYLYDAAGIKLSQEVYNNKTKTSEETNYVGNFIYDATLNLKFILSDEGRLIPKTGGGFEYEYFIKDHLGNNRVTIKESNGNAVVMQEDHYYPFGMVLGGQSYAYADPLKKNDYLYNGKELQDELGLTGLGSMIQ
jgi:hypothetical protein